MRLHLFFHDDQPISLLSPRSASELINKLFKEIEEYKKELWRGEDWKTKLDLAEQKLWRLIKAEKVNGRLETIASRMMQINEKHIIFFISTAWGCMINVSEQNYETYADQRVFIPTPDDPQKGIILPDTKKIMEAEKNAEKDLLKKGFLYKDWLGNVFLVNPGNAKTPLSGNSIYNWDEKKTRMEIKRLEGFYENKFFSFSFILNGLFKSILRRVAIEQFWGWNAPSIIINYMPISDFSQKYFCRTSLKLEKKPGYYEGPFFLLRKHWSSNEGKYLPPPEEIESLTIYCCSEDKDEIKWVTSPHGTVSFFLRFFPNVKEIDFMPIDSPEL